MRREIVLCLPCLVLHLAELHLDSLERLLQIAAGLAEADESLRRCLRLPLSQLLNELTVRHEKTNHGLCSRDALVPLPQEDDWPHAQPHGRRQACTQGARGCSAASSVQAQIAREPDARHQAAVRIPARRIWGALGRPS